MFIASCAHVWAFPAKEFSEHPQYRRAYSQPILTSILSISNPIDVLRDINDIVRSPITRGSRVKLKHQQRHASQQSG